MKDPRSILITGASSGIGAGLALAYARPGIRLALTARNAARLDEVAAGCRAAGAETDQATLDVTEAANLAAWIEGADRRRPLELVIANAGITGGDRGDREGETLAELRRVMAVNFDGVCATLHAVLPAMRARRRGQLALMSSLAGLRGLPYSPAYCASKAALIAYGDALRAWLRPDGIGVSVVLPGFVDTPLSGHVEAPKPLMMTPERAARIIRRGLAQGRARIAFPWRLHLGVRIMAALPPALVDPVLNRVSVGIRPYR